MLNTLRDILDFRRLPEIAVSNRSLLWQFVKRSVSARYRGSMLGIFWSFVQPMMMLCVYTFVFSVVLKSRWGMDGEGGRASFAIIMFCGLALFNLIPIPPLDGSKVVGYFTSAKVDAWFIQNQQIVRIVFLIILFTGLLSTPLSWLSSKLYEFLWMITDWIPKVFG